MWNASPSLPPGFRFHPTDEELILHYLSKRAVSAPCPVAIIAEVDIYKFNPWDLPAKAMFGEREWYFFSPRDRKYPNGFRPNRAAASGYWKATGTDKPITTGRSRKEYIGVKKALVFYKGKPPKGVKTNWIMHEYRLAETLNQGDRKQVQIREASMRLDDWVLCRIYQKSSHRSPAEREQDSNTNKMSKSFSISDLLIEETDFSLLTRLLEMDRVQVSNTNLNQFFIDNTNCNDNSSYLNMNSQAIESGGSVLVAEENQKLQIPAENYCFEDWGGHLNGLKKLGNSNFSAQFNNHFESSQSFFNEQSDAQFSIGNALSLNIYNGNI